MPPTRSTARLFAAGPDHLRVGSRVVEINLGDPRCSGLDGLRAIVVALGESHPAIVAAARRHRSEWNVLFPGAFPDAVPLGAISATCSERRLHAESEQVFRVISAVGDAVVGVAAEEPITLMLRGAGRLDIPSLRAVPHLLERAGLTGADLQVVLADWAAWPDLRVPGDDSADAQIRTLRERLLDALARRLAVAVEPGQPGEPAGPVIDLPARSPEARCQAGLVAHASAEERIGAALGAMRGAFFSTNHDAGVWAAQRLLAELDAAGAVDLAAVREAVATTDADDPGSLGVDAAAVDDRDSLRSLAHRYIGMTHVFLLDHRTALEHLGRAVGLGTPAVRARARLLRALLLIKRLGEVADGFADVAAGLAELGAVPDEAAPDEGPEWAATSVAKVEAAWLHNVRALGYVQLGRLSEAMADERRAIRLVGKLSGTDATHLKVNLVSNVSVLKEYSGQPLAAVHAWRQFSRRSGDWGPTFFKHHAYREGGLLARAGAAGEARTALETAHRLAGEAGDGFYGAHIALEIAHLERVDPFEAQRWYEAADRHAREVGDPYLAALATTGRALTRGGGELSDADRRAALELLSLSTSYPEEIAALSRALRSGTGQEVADRLPAVRTKLNRPFRPVRIELSAIR